MAKTPSAPSADLPRVDKQTARCLKELRDVIEAIEAGELALRRFTDDLVEQDGLHREITIRTTFVPRKA